MAIPSAATLGGYLLEEALAHLLHGNGYRLIREAVEDTDALVDGPSGLSVRGRGANHQADVLGQLLLPSPFSHPVRLFLEAKNRRRKAGLADVRNAHGVLFDVNERYSQDLDLEKPLLRFQYRYALFSTAGFTKDAQTFALAHQITLVDLSGPGFADLVSAVDRAASALHGEAERQSVRQFPVRAMRLSVRRALDRLDGDRSPVQDRTSASILGAFLDEWAAAFVARLSESATGEGLVLGFPAAPFVLAMRPASMTALEGYLAGHDHDIEVDVRFALDDQGGAARGDWEVTPRDQPDAFRLTFGVPGGLEAVLLSEDAAGQESAFERDFLSTINLFVEDRLIRLRYTRLPRAARTPDEADFFAEDASGSSFLRASLPARPRAPRPADDPEPPRPRRAQPSPGPGWSREAVAELLRRLDDGGYVQGRLIRAAAANGGELDRAAVYEIAGYPADRTLRGLSRPTNRITAQMIRQEMLPPDAMYPFKAHYGSGVRASQFEVDQDVVAVLRRHPEM